MLPEELAGDDIVYHINPTGRFVVGGPHGDCGLTGRKIIVDTYGGWGRHGGGAFSGKDPTKVDRSAAYMARYVAKNIVASGLAERCEVQLAYAIGVSEPVSIHVDTEGTGRIDDARICELVRENFPLTPSGIIKHLDLRRPIYRKTAAGGHFGRNEPEFTWEKTDKAKQLAKAAQVDGCRRDVIRDWRRVVNGVTYVGERRSLARRDRMVQLRAVADRSWSPCVDHSGVCAGGFSVSPPCDRCARPRRCRLRHCC